MKEVMLGERPVGQHHPALIVAEIGNNHDGSIGLARNLIDAAKEAGVDAVKCQTHIADAEMLPLSPRATHFPENRYAFTKRMELTLEQHEELKIHAQRRSLIFFSTAFSKEGVDLLDYVGVPCFKVGSGDVTDFPLLEHIGRKGKPVLMSTGMSSWEEIDGAMEQLRKYEIPVVLLQCTSKYPCPHDEVGLPLLEEFRVRFGVPVGLSDHTPSIYTALAAVSLGACIIEKHFTLSRRMYGPDHQVSLIPEEMAALVEGVRAVEAAMIDRDKNKDAAKLQEIRRTFQKSIVTRVNIGAGEVISEEMLVTKRPGTGISANLVHDVVGKRVTRGIPAGTILEWDWIIG